MLVIKPITFWTLILLCTACSGSSPAPTDPVESGSPDPTPEDSGPTDPVDGRSALYPEYWTPGFSFSHPDYEQTLFLQDYSYAGYRNGEQALPEASSGIIQVEASTDGSSDASSAIQAALEQAVTNGGGIVYLPAGLYRIDNPLSIEGSNIVLRGAGSDQTRLWFRAGGGTTEEHKINLLITGASWLNEEARADWRIAQDGEIFDTWVELTRADGIQPGDDISIAWNITEDFKAEHNSEDYWYHSELGTRKTFFRRTVTQVDGNRVHFKVPLRYPVKLRDDPVVLRANGYGSENGIEALSFTNAVGVEQAWASFDQATAIVLRFCKDCWIRDVKSFAREGASHHIRSHGITIERSFRVTVADSHLAKTEHLGEGGNGYLFQLTRTNEVLIQDSSGRDARHNFTINWDFGASGNVFHGIESSGGRVCSSLENQLSGDCSLGPSDFHHALAIANLFDNAKIDDGLQVGNRQQWSVGAGQTGTQNLFWNITGEGEVYAYNQGLGYVIGTGTNIDVSTDLGLSTWPESHLSPGTAPEDYTELLGEADELVPQSLYDNQLERRLKNAE